MSDFDVPRRSAETMLKGWSETVGLPVAYDNVPFDSTKYDEWVRVTVLNGDSFEAAVGSNCVRNTGLITVQIFTNQWDGSSACRQYADQIADIFKGVVDKDVTYRAGALTRVGHDGDFFQMNIVIPYQHDVNDAN